MTSRAFLLAITLLASTVPAAAQTAPASAAPDGGEPPLRRWIEIQNFTIYSRYRFAESSKVKTSDQLQYKDTFRARFNVDPEKRYTINFGYFSGSSFISTWNNWGAGNNTTFDSTNNYMKQLYASAIPVDGLELQYGGLYVIRGEFDEFVSYDEDGYIVGERVSARRPKDLFFDEVSVTRAFLGDLTQPNVGGRWHGLGNPNYTQVLAAKKINAVVGASADYTRDNGSDTFRGAITLHFKKTAPIHTLRYEQYVRTNNNSAAGFGVWADRTLSRHLKLQGGYITIDQFYGALNADRVQNGRRIFAIATIPICGPLAASIYATHAFDAPYTLVVYRRFDAVISYDVLDTLRRTKIF